uniref:Uncharacterized protein n=1 Tax=Glossina brevipalpis TaxID=37001 RepID=A0A1A9W524_9MUSC
MSSIVMGQNLLTEYYIQLHEMYHDLVIIYLIGISIFQRVAGYIIDTNSLDYADTNTIFITCTYATSIVFRSAIVPNAILLQSKAASYVMNDREAKHTRQDPYIIFYVCAKIGRTICR